MRTSKVGWLIAATLLATACHTMTPLSWDELNGLRPSRVWITQTNQSVFEVSGPQVFGDTLVGYVNGQFRELPTADVKQVSVRRAARGKTIALIAAGTAGAAAIGVWMSGIGDRSARDLIDCDYEPEHPDCQ